MLANWLIGQVTGVKLHDYGFSLKAYRAEIVKNVPLYGEMHRFIPALASWYGSRIAELPVTHHARRHGKTKYGINRTFRVMLDLITVKFLLSFYAAPANLRLLGRSEPALGGGDLRLSHLLRLAFDQGYPGGRPPPPACS